MSDIPDDIMAAAEDAFMHASIMSLRNQQFEIIARAIMGERERCAKVALNVAKEFAGAGLDAHSIGASRVGDGILDAALATPGEG